MSNIHIKIEQPEAIATKKNILILEKDLLETAKHIKNYTSLRKQEFAFKIKLKKDFGILNNLILDMESQLPKEEIMTTKKAHKENSKIEIKIPKKISEERKNSIEQQIDEIRAKLAQLG